MEQDTICALATPSGSGAIAVIRISGPKSLEITDKSITVKAKCWDVLDLKKGKAYVAHFKTDKYGWTMMNDGFVTQIDL